MMDLYTDAVISAGQTNRGFLPLLLKVDVSTDLLDPGDDLWVTCWWQNIGEIPACSNLTGFMDIEFGNQRIIETINKYNRIIWQPYPGLHHWKKGEVWATTCRWHIPEGGIWGGTFKLYLGFCDENSEPYTIYGMNREPAKRIHAGEVDVAWGWGKPSLQKQRKSWTAEFNHVYEEERKAIKDGSPDGIVMKGDISVTLDHKIPSLVSLGRSDTIFSGMKLEPEVFIRHRKSDKIYREYYPGSAIKYVCRKTDDVTCTYHAAAFFMGNKAAEWDVVFNLDRSRLTVGIQNLSEEKEYELLEFRLPGLVTVSGSDARLVDFYGDGRLISPDEARPVGYEHPYDVRNAAVIYNSRGMAVMESKGLDDKLFACVYQNLGGKYAVLGIGLTCRVKATGELPSIPVADSPSVTIDLPDERWGLPSWQAAARFLRKDLCGKNRDLYRRVFLYKYHIAWGPHPDGYVLTEETPYPIKRLSCYNSFHKALEDIRKVSRLIDGCRQVVYLTGFQCNGHDTGYPYVFETDPRAGSPEDLRNCIVEAEKCNAWVGMHDNYDDAYELKNQTQEILALNEQGKPYKIWFWSSGMSYAISHRKYAMSGQMQERVRRTVDFYGIRKTYHLDVLSSEVRRYDFDPQCPSAADENLLGKLAVVDEFNKYGIDLTSENITHPFVGAIGYGWWTRYNPGSVLFYGEKNIPLTPMVYHGTIQYNCSGSSKKDLIEGMLRGASHTWSENEQQIGVKHIRGFYLQTLPMGLLYDLKIEDYAEENGYKLTYFEQGSYVKADIDDLRYEISVNGRIVGKDWTTFAPGFKEGSWLAYSIKKGEFRYEAPPGWSNGKAVRAAILTPDGEGSEISCKLEDGQLVMLIPGDTPVRVEPV